MLPAMAARRSSSRSRSTAAMLLALMMAMAAVGSCDGHRHRHHHHHRREEEKEEDGNDGEGGGVSAEGRSDRVRHGLPGQPDDESDDDAVSQFAGYVTVNASHGRALFYWFVQARSNPSAKPLLLWLNGGPGCSSIGYGATEEIGPFYVNPDGSTLSVNHYSWIKEANLLFVESPVGVGFSYSNTSSDYSAFGDTQTALDAHAFLVGWFKKFPKYRSHDFYITGESYAGHYIPQLAKLIVDRNEGGGLDQIINLKGIMIGNALIDDAHDSKGIVDYAWSHGVISDQFYKNITRECNFMAANLSDACISYYISIYRKYEAINIYDVIADVCNGSSSAGSSRREFPLRIPNPKFGASAIVRLPNGRAGANDPCIDNYVYAYLNREDVQRALHANTTSLPYAWSPCSGVLRDWVDAPSTVLPILTELMAKGLRVWLFSGDMDGRIPFLSTQYSIGSLQLPILADWYPWYHDGQVAGWTEVYPNLTFATVRGAGHMVATFQPQRALALLRAFIRGEPLPSY